MLKLKYAKNTPEVQEVKEVLKELSLAFKLEQDTTLQHLVLEDGDHPIQGLPAIKVHLEQLSSELKKWWYCDC